MRSRSALFALLAAASLAGCAGGDGDSAVPAAAVPELEGAQARPAATGPAAALGLIADTPATQGRLGFVAPRRMAEVEQVLPAGELLNTVLGPGGSRVRALDASTVQSAVQVGEATVLRGTALPEGAPAGADGVVLGGDVALVGLLQTERPNPNVLTLRGPSVVQQCLGDTVAQTTVRRLKGVRVAFEAAAAGLRTSPDAPAGTQLVLCYAPQFLRQVDASLEVLEERYGDLEPAPVISEVEYGEDTAVSAVLPAAALKKAEIRDLLGGGEELLALFKR